MKIHPAIQDVIPTEGLNVLCPFCKRVCVYTQVDNDTEPPIPIPVFRDLTGEVSPAIVFATSA